MSDRPLLSEARSLSHDFHRQGSRVAWRRDILGWHVWLEESAPYHAYGSSKWGAEFWRTGGLMTSTVISLEAGRYAFRASRPMKETP